MPLYYLDLPKNRTAPTAQDLQEIGQLHTTAVLAGAKYCDADRAKRMAEAAVRRGGNSPTKRARLYLALLEATVRCDEAEDAERVANNALRGRAVLHVLPTFQ